jgi:ATP-dependent exoDNAse (exonuclease V) beta subunit
VVRAGQALSRAPESVEQGPGESRSLLSLRTNFRSDPRLLTYVNAVLEGVMVEKSDAPWEIGYAPLEPNPGRARG